MYRTNGKVNREKFAEIRQYLLSPRQKGIFFFLAGIGIFDIIFGGRQGSMMIVLFGVLLVILTVVEVAVILRKLERLTFARLAETTGKEEFSYTTWFENDGMHILNEDTGGSAVLAYSTFGRMYETESFYLLFTGKWQMAFVFRDKLDEEYPGEFREFIRKLMPHIRIK